MSLPSFSVKNHVLVNMIMIVMLVAGTAFAFTLIREFFPESRPNKILISAIYPGVQPQEIEKSVTIKIEEAIRDIEGIEKINSTVSESISTTIASLLNEVDNPEIVLQKIKNEIDSIQDIPDEVEQISTYSLIPKLPVISVAVFGEGSESDRKKATRDLKDELLALPGVSDVVLTGLRDDEISIEIIPDRLLEFNISFDEVADSIAQSNLDISGGNLKGSRSNTSIRTLGEETRGRDLEDIIIRSMPDGRKIYLKDIATIKDDFVDTDLESFFNGSPAASCIIYKTANQDAIQISTLVKAFVAGKNNQPIDPYGFTAAYEKPWYAKPFSLIGCSISYGIGKFSGRPDPQVIYEQSRNNPFDHNFKVELHTDLARFIEGRLDLLTRNGKYGLILVLISLNLFLNWRVAFWAAIGLPVSFLGTFIVMWLLGATINLLTMFGLIIVLGIIVDDAIVIGENIYRHIEEGMNPIKAAVIGAEEVMWPVTVAVTTTIAAFAPLFFIKGQIGDFMHQLPLVVLAALTVSLIEALVILPAHLAHLPSKEEQDERERKKKLNPGIFYKAHQRFSKTQDYYLKYLFPSIYEYFLRICLRWRYVTVAVSVSTLVVVWGFFEGGLVNRVFVQEMDSETMSCSLEMPVGTISKNTRERLKTINDYVLSLPEIVNVQMMVGSQVDINGDGTAGSNNQSHLGQLIIELRAADERELRNERSSFDLLRILRDYSNNIPGVNSIQWGAVNGAMGGRDVEIKVSGKNFEDITAVSKEIKKQLYGFTGVFDIDDDYDKGKREIQLKLYESARATGITVAKLGREIRWAMYGREARRITRNREDVKIMVRYPEEFRKNVYNLESMWIPSNKPNGEQSWVPLKEIAFLSETDSFSTIHRSQQERSISVMADVDENTASSSEILEQVKIVFDEKIQPNYPGTSIEFLGSAEEQAKAFGGLKIAFPVALLVVYMLLAGLFRSYTQPLVVMSAIPFGMQGAIIGHWLTNNPMTILSWIGLVALTGILVNDSLVLVDFINTRIRDGLGHFEATVQGSKLRLRAILLTTLTTVAGLTPMMFETSFQAKFLIPMAVTLTFGLIFATAITLIIVPSINLIYFDFLVTFLGKDKDFIPNEFNEADKVLLSKELT